MKKKKIVVFFELTKNEGNLCKDVMKNMEGNFPGVHYKTPNT